MNRNIHNKLNANTANYYSKRFKQHGKTAQGVDWKDSDSQTLRFQQLTDFLPTDTAVSLNDLGCGYGALFSFLRNSHPQLTYNGIDIVPEMIDAARQTISDPRAQLEVAGLFTEPADYTVASGIFNVKQDADMETWEQYVFELIDHMNAFSRLGFGFNCLTSHSDPAFMRAHLYYADPGRFLNYCLERYGRTASLMHGYGLYEFTIVVNKAGIPRMSNG